ncbi:MAG TPA: UvrD-helicase domain-containing protein [Kofleriaceae bacterium]|nr:UvrD-helicase domain-containing protein [Kofleriaceae bacterium]
MIKVARPASLPPASDKLVVVEASAGTGKTFFLEHRVVDLILAGAELGQILLVTFTDKAVAELRMRIRDLLDRLARATTDTAKPGEPCWELDDDARRRLRSAVTAFDHAPIFTIHGFCHRVLVEDAFAAKRLFDQTQVADEVAFDGAFGALLRERFARVAPDRELLAAYLMTGKTVDDLRKLLLQCTRADATVRPMLADGRIRDLVQDLIDRLGTPDQRAAVMTMKMDASGRRYMPEWLEQIGEVLAPVTATTPAPQLLAVIDQLREPVGKVLDRVAKSPAHGELASALRAVLVTGSLDEAIASTLLPHILERIGHDKSERGLFDYDDMLVLVEEALHGERAAELATRLRTRTPWVMIDEFQDTDPVQWNIFRTVWLHAEARGLTIVGDPKQAIYGFRGADVLTYVAAREEMLRAGATRVQLAVNRRSTAPLVEAVNTILVGDPFSPLLDKAITYEHPVSASGDVVCDDTRAPIAVLQLQGKSDKPKSDDVKLALLDAIGGAIEELRAAPPAWSLRGATQRFSLGQVMVLTRSNRDSAEVAAALRGRGLPCALVEPEKLFATREAYELAAVLAAIAAPRDRSARLRALRTRYFDVPWADLMRVVDGPDHHPLIAQIFDWAQLAVRRAYEPLFRRLVEDSRFAERALVLGGGERALTNTWHLIELLLAEVARARCDLHELVVQLRRWIADDTIQPDERDVQRAETEAEAIRILTIHKAKGLEAPYVFLYGGSGPAPKSSVKTLRDATGRALIVGPPDPATQQRLEDEATGENQRLAYVALTRAQVRMYLPQYPTINKDAAYQPIQRCVTAAVNARAKHPRAWFDVVPVAVEVEEPPPPPADALASFVAPAPPDVPELAPLASVRGGLAVVSYTRLAALPDAAALAARPGDVLAIDPAEFDTDVDAAGSGGGEVGATDLPPGASSGLFLHDLLEAADLDDVRHARDLAAWEAMPGVKLMIGDHGRERGVAAEFHRHAAEVAFRTLTAPLALIDGTTRPPLVEATAIAREVEIWYPLPGHERRGLVRGFIDALVAWDDELWVVDYKSDVLAGEDQARAAEQRVREHYAVQARLYAIAADRMRGRRKLAGLLFAFVRYGVVVPVRLADDTLDVWMQWLAALPVMEARR